MAHEIRPDGIHIAPLTREHAEDISTWRYVAPYEVYDMVGADPEELLDPSTGYHAVMAGDRLIGFRSFGRDGQVPGWGYDDSALDTGGVGSFKASRDAEAFDVLVRPELR